KLLSTATRGGLLWSHTKQVRERRTRPPPAPGCPPPVRACRSQAGCSARSAGSWVADQRICSSLQQFCTLRLTILQLSGLFESIYFSLQERVSYDRIQRELGVYRLCIVSRTA